MAVKRAIDHNNSFIAELFPDGLIELDSTNAVIACTTAACAILRQPPEAITGKSLSSLFPQGLQADIEALASSKTARGTLTIHYENQWIKLRLEHLPEVSGYNGSLLFLQNVTQEIETSQEMSRLNRRLQDSRHEIEKRLIAIRSLEEIFRKMHYPYAQTDVVQVLLQFFAKVFDADACSAIVSEEKSKPALFFYFNKDIGEENFRITRNEIVQRYRRTYSSQIDPASIHVSRAGVSLSSSGALQGQLAGSMQALVRNEAPEFAMHFSFHSTRPGAFTPFDEQIVELIVHVTFDAIRNMKSVVESERKKMRAMVESMVDGVLMTDQNDEVVIMNQAARKILRVSRKEDSINKKYFQENLGFYPFRLTKGLIHKSSVQATIKEEIKVFDKTLHSVVAPVYDAEGKQTGTVVVLRDITEQKEMEERKSDFLSIISHELRTPLASIGGSLDLVLDKVVGEVSEKQRRYLELAKDSCRKLNVVIDDLLDISKFEKGKMEVHMEQISIVQLVEEAVEKFQASAIEKEILLKLEKTGSDIKIYGDYVRLLQVMNNLLSNAIKFTPLQGEIELRIFTPRVVSPHVGVSVKDTGPGIRTEDLERVFDKFEQVRRSDTRKIGGTGLGLAISRSIIESHKGKIWAECKPGEGARFIFLLPVDKRATVSEEIYADINDNSRLSDVRAILIAGDPDTAYLLKGALLEREINVTLSYSAQEGFNLIQRKNPDLILIDLDADAASGNQLIDILSHDPDTADTPVIAFTGKTESVLSDAGNFFLIKKPIEMEKFAQALAVSLSKIHEREKRHRILLIDDDENMRAICREALQYQNYQVSEAPDGVQALEQLKYQKPDLILMDIMLPGLDGLQLAQIIRSNISTSHIPIVFLTAKGQTEDKVRALRAGGNDYLVKPVDSTELAARIETILKRTESELSASPTTKLPGSVAIEKEINQLISQNEKFALCYLDLDNLKSYNDEYGYAKADAVVKQTGDIIRDTVLQFGHPTDFVGHIAGDDFLFITQPDRVDEICLRIIERFDRIIPFFYRIEDRERGYIEGKDRYGVWRKFPILSLSVVCLTNEQQQLTDHMQIATVAAEYKRNAKAMPGSVYIRNGKTISMDHPSV